LAVLDEIEHLAPPHAALVLDQVLGFDTTGPVELTPGELRAAVRTAGTATSNPDGTITWTSPTRGVYKRKTKRTIPPQIPPGSQLPPLEDPS
ncbi:MAG: hypothetical protein JWM62_1779, partial [Frankiales bacterium]|nr:hypothetical protein [Frankiales bacterium]